MVSATVVPLYMDVKSYQASTQVGTRQDKIETKHGWHAWRALSLIKLISELYNSAHTWGLCTMAHVGLFFSEVVISIFDER